MKYRSSVINTNLIVAITCFFLAAIMTGQLCSYVVDLGNEHQYVKSKITNTLQDNNIVTSSIIKLQSHKITNTVKGEK